MRFDEDGRQIAGDFEAAITQLTNERAFGDELEQIIEMIDPGGSARTSIGIGVVARATMLRQHVELPHIAAPNQLHRVETALRLMMFVYRRHPTATCI